MSEVRVLVGTRKGAFILRSDERRADWSVEGPPTGRWKGRISLAGRSITSPGLRRIPTGCTPPLRPGGMDKSSNGRTMAGRTGKSSVTASPMTVRREPINGMTAPSTPGNSSASGIWKPYPATPTRSKLVWKMRPCFTRRMAVKAGESFPAYAA